MQRTSDHIWISFGFDDGHTLHPATVCGGDGEGPICRFDTAADPADIVPGSTGDGQGVVYFNGPGGFSQQPATLVRTDTDAGPALRLVPTGVAAVAEERQNDRFVVEAFGLSAVLAGDDVCPLADVSPRGLSVSSERLYEMGQVVEVAFELPSDASVHTGYCRVRSLKSEGRGGRYGLLALEGTEGGSVPAGLREIIDWIRRSELRRMPKAG